MKIAIAIRGNIGGTHHASRDLDFKLSIGTADGDGLGLADDGGGFPRN